MNCSPFGCANRPERFSRSAEAGEVHRLVVELHLAPLELIHFDNVVEDIAEGDGADVNGLQVFQLLVVQLGIEQDAAQADDAVKRRTQLVADRGDKGGLLPAGVLQRVR